MLRVQERVDLWQVRYYFFIPTEEHVGSVPSCPNYDIVQHEAGRAFSRACFGFFFFFPK
jgi:hypothetical protein